MKVICDCGGEMQPYGFKREYFEYIACTVCGQCAIIGKNKDKNLGNDVHRDIAEEHIYDMFGEGPKKDIQDWVNKIYRQWRENQ